MKYSYGSSLHLPLVLSLILKGGLDAKKDEKKKHNKEKDFLLINLQLRLIIAIEAKFNLSSRTYKEAKVQLESTKNILFRWFQGDLDKTWTLITMIYCQQKDKKYVIESSDEKFIIIGNKGN